MTPEVKKRIEQIRQGIVPDGYTKTRSEITPTTWTPACLGDIYTERKEPGNESLPLLTVSIHSGVSDGELDEDELPKKVKRIEDKSQYKRAATGDLVFNMMRAWQGAIGTVRTEGMVSPAYIVAKPNGKVYPPFMDYYMKAPRMVGMINRQSYGVTDFRKRLYWDSFAPIPCVLPPVREQKKIAEILSAQDKAIELQGRKIEELKRFKKGCLEKMFPRKGQKVPEKRFPGFTDDWEQKKFSSLYIKVNEKNDLSFGTDRIISVANMYFKADIKESSDEYLKTYNVMRLGDIAFEGNKSKNYAHGRFVENTIGDGIISHVFDVFRPIAEYDLQFWKYLINDEGIMGSILTRCTKASTMMTNLVAEDFLKETIAVPSLNEQRKIGMFLNRVDDYITLHQRKLEEMKRQKKALMQLLLTGIVRV